jgi:hypothetical protein
MPVWPLGGVGCGAADSLSRSRELARRVTERCPAAVVTVAVRLVSTLLRSTQEFPGDNESLLVSG